jgi:hypothetical protein
LTQIKEITLSKEKAEEDVDIGVMAANAAQKSAVLAQKVIRSSFRLVDDGFAEPLGEHIFSWSRVSSVVGPKRIDDLMPTEYWNGYERPHANGVLYRSGRKTACQPSTDRSV